MKQLLTEGVQVPIAHSSLPHPIRRRTSSTYQLVRNVFSLYHTRGIVLLVEVLPPTSRRSIGDATETIADSSGLRILNPFSGLASAL
jgi:hypothetical protein